MHEAEETAEEVRFIALQNEYSLLHRNPETEGTLDVSSELGLAFVPYFPLASGLLTGKYRLDQEKPTGTRLADREIENDKLQIVEKLITFTESRGRTILELAFSWLLMKPAVTSVIAGATRPEQVHANAAAASWVLSAEEMAEVNQIIQN